MNEVMRRSACCLLSALLLCSCVGCANSVHEISEGDAAQRTMMQRSKRIKRLLWTLWTVLPPTISITQTNWF